MSLLYSPTTLGPLALQIRFVMAPLTRSRAIGNVPNPLMADYYAQHATAGLIVTEGTAPSPNGLGYARIPGLFSPAQVAGWQTVTQAVHAKGAKIVVQLMHCGRIAHPLNLPDGARIVAPSAVAAAGEMFTDTLGLQPHPVPTAMTASDIAATIGEYVQAGVHALAAGFDGVELHAANGYLMEQFLRPTSNRRTDEYGGSREGRARFVLEIARATLAAVAKAGGKGVVGIRLSPFGTFNDMPLYPELEADYAWLAGALEASGIDYVHLVDHSSMGTPAVPDSIKATFRSAFTRTLILSGGYDAVCAEADLAAGRCDLVAFGRTFLANPDLIARWRAGAPLNAPDASTFYTPGAAGYTDYPVLAA